MPAAMTEYQQDKYVKHLFNDATWTPPSALYLAAFTTTTTQAGGGVEAVGYTRVQIDGLMAHDGAGSGTYSNTSLVSFTDLPDATYVAVAVFDAATSGNMVHFCQLTTPKTTTDGTLPFPIGNLVIGAN